ncbi:MAG: pilus assembly FimT family protein [Coraliomargarita sp.]
MAKKVAATTSATGKSKPVRRASGFTLIEICLVLGLIATVTGLFIMNFVSITERTDDISADEVLLQVTREARFLAARSRSTTSLRYDAESGSLQIANGTGDTESFPLGEPFSSERSAEVRFYLVPASEGLSPAQDPERTRMEANEVRFAPDRSSSPFVVELDYGDGSPERMIFDPFSNLVKEPK